MTIAAVDVETRDPNLKDLGVGALRGDGEILTVGVYCPDWDIDGWYTWEQFQEDEEVQELLKDKDVIKVFHNGLYDLEWLCEWGGIEINNTDDTMTRETLLDAYSWSYSLDNCCAKHNVQGKNKDDTIDNWWIQHGGKGKAVQHLAEIPIDIVGSYNLQDCHATYDLWFAQQPLLEEQGLIDANNIERRLIPWLLKTKRCGIKIDKSQLAELTADVQIQYMRAQLKWEMEYGDVNFSSTKQLTELFLKRGWQVPLKRGTNTPTFEADALTDIDLPIGQQIIELRALKKLLTTYLEGQFPKFMDNGGFIHGELHPAKSDDGGTVTGRFSSSRPNQQNISAREEKHGKEVRSMFVPVNNAEAIRLGYDSADGWLLGAFDYKQIEYRAFTHFAIACNAPGSEEAYLKFKENPDTDYHEMVQRLMGWFFPDDKARTKVYRHVTKNLNFGSIYGLGAASFAHKFRQPLRMAHPDYKGSLQTLAKELLDTYFEKIPFARFTGQMIQKTAERRGYVLTLGKRRARFPQDKKAYKMVNYLVQGSAGDIIKKAIADSWDAGIWDVLVPHNMVHDELVFSIPDSKEGYEACCKLRDCMANAYKLHVPIGVDTEIGPDWGHCDGDNWEAFEKKWS